MWSSLEFHCVEKKWWWNILKKSITYELSYFWFPLPTNRVVTYLMAGGINLPSASTICNTLESTAFFSDETPFVDTQVGSPNYWSDLKLSHNTGWLIINFYKQ